MDIYTQAATAAKRKAQSKVVEMIVPEKSGVAGGTGLTLPTVT